MDEYRVKVTVRNNLLLSAIELAGYKTQTAFADACGLGTSEVNAIVGLRKAPINELGEFCKTAKIMMEVLGALPQELWTEKQLFMDLDRNTSEKTFCEHSFLEMANDHISTMTLPDPFDVVVDAEKKSELMSLIDSALTPREAKAIKIRYGLDGLNEHTLSESGKALNVSQERMRQIEAKSFRKLRKPTRAIEICGLGDDNPEREEKVKAIYKEYLNREEMIKKFELEKLRITNDLE